MQQIVKELFQEQTISKEESQLVFSKLSRSTINKGDLLLRPNEEINTIYYVQSGCLRNYILDQEGKEHTFQFAVKGWWVSDYIALYGKQKTLSVSYVECIKNAVLYSISKADFDSICQAIPQAARIYIRKMEIAFASFQSRIVENQMFPAKQRYLNFLDAYPGIANEVKNYHIASYLGITTESLSRIRKEISAS